MRQHEVIAKNVETAIAQGLAELGLSREEVDIKIIDAGGMFKKARIVLEYTPKEPECTCADCHCDEGEPCTCDDCQCECDCCHHDECDCDDCDECHCEECECDDCECEECECEECECGECHCDDECDCGCAEATQPAVVKKPRTFKPVVKNPELEERLKEFLNGLMFAMKVRGSVTCSYSEDALIVSVNGDNVGKLIGFRGETLNAIQAILTSIARHTPERTRVIFDVENYREKRERTLIALGKKMVKKAQMTRKEVHLEPMTPYERMIIHTALQEYTDITTDSTGVGDRRHIVIKVIK